MVYGFKLSSNILPGDFAELVLLAENLKNLVIF